MSTDSSRKNILVVGATGKQGGAVIKALLALPKATDRLHILAVTRKPDSAGAKALAAAYPDAVTIIAGDTTNPRPIFATQPHGSIAAAFLVTVMGDEEAQGKPFIDAAIDHGVSHIVFSSLDRGGDEKSWTNPTNIKHFYQKHNVELYLRDRAAESDGRVTWTILRPVAFLDNLNPGPFCGMMVAMWAAALSPTTKLQHISTRDIGIFAARALTDPAAWAGRAVGLAGDEMTLDELKERFHKATGKTLPQSWTVLGRLLQWVVGDVGRMFAFFEREGYHANIDELRKEAGADGLWDLEEWLKKGSKWNEQ